MQEDVSRARAVAAQFDAYRSAISETFVPLEATMPRTSTFTSDLRNRGLGPLTVADIRAGEHTVNRSARGIRASDPGHFKLGLQVRGYSVLSQDGREAALTPGDLALYDTSRPYSLSFAAEYRMLVVMVPRNLLRLPERPVAALTAHRISGRTGTGALLSPLLLRLTEQSTPEDPAVSRPVGEAVADLLSAVLAEQLQLAAPMSPETHQRALVMRVRAFIAERLGDPDLSPTRIAEAHHVSVRYLHRLFEAEGQTINGWIRAERLERCRRDLTDPRFADVTAAMIGARWGLTNAAHFSRLFRAAYGTTPGGLRAADGISR